MTDIKIQNNLVLNKCAKLKSVVFVFVNSMLSCLF